jgi:hypothetical protein
MIAKEEVKTLEHHKAFVPWLIECFFASAVCINCFERKRHKLCFLTDSRNTSIGHVLPARNYFTLLFCNVKVLFTGRLLLSLSTDFLFKTLCCVPEVEVLGYHTVAIVVMHNSHHTIHHNYPRNIIIIRWNSSSSMSITFSSETVISAVSLKYCKMTPESRNSGARVKRSLLGNDSVNRFQLNEHARNRRTSASMQRRGKHASVKTEKLLENGAFCEGRPEAI